MKYTQVIMRELLSFVRGINVLPSRDDVDSQMTIVERAITTGV